MRKVYIKTTFRLNINLYPKRKRKVIFTAHNNYLDYYFKGVEILKFIYPMLGKTYSFLV